MNRNATGRTSLIRLDNGHLGGGGQALATQREGGERAKKSCSEPSCCWISRLPLLFWRANEGLRRLYRREKSPTDALFEAYGATQDGARQRNSHLRRRPRPTPSGRCAILGFFTTEHTENCRRATEGYNNFLGELRAPHELLRDGKSLTPGVVVPSVALRQFSVSSVVKKASY